jgi:hypothetical protein
MDYTELRALISTFKTEVYDRIKAVNKGPIRIPDVAYGWGLARGMDLKEAASFKHEVFGCMEGWK